MFIIMTIFGSFTVVGFLFVLFATLLVPFVMTFLSIFRAVLLPIFFMTAPFSRSGSAGAHTTASAVASLAMMVAAAAALFLVLFVATTAPVSVFGIITVIYLGA